MLRNTLIAMVILIGSCAQAQVPPVTTQRVRTIVGDSAAALRSSLTVNTGLTRAKSYGDFTVFGHVPIVNRATFWDTSAMTCTNGTRLSLSLPSSIVGDAQAADTASFLHPSTVYYPNGFGTSGHKLWAAFSMNSGAKIVENCFIRVSDDDGTTWSLPGSTPDPLFDSAACNDSTGHAISYFSDPFLFPGTDGKLYCGIRAVYGYSGEIYLWVRSTSDGSTWSTAKVMMGVLYAQPNLLSPCVWLDTGGLYVMIAGVTASSSAYARTRIVRYTSLYADSAWDYNAGDTVTQSGATGTYVNFPTGASTSITTDDTLGNRATYSYGSGSGWVPWHFGVVDIASDQKIILITARDSAMNSNSAFGQSVLFYAATTDGGKSVKLIGSQPFLRPTGTATWDSAFLYKASGWIQDRGWISPPAPGRTSSSLSKIEPGRI